MTGYMELTEIEPNMRAIEGQALLMVPQLPLEILQKILALASCWRRYTASILTLSRHTHACTLVLRDESTLIDLLGLCRGITCLSVAVNTDEFSEDPSRLLWALNTLPLKSLTMLMEVNCLSAIKTSHTFHNLMHLDINDQLLMTEPYTGLEDLRLVTHIIVVLAMGQSMVESVKHLLSNVTLRVLGLRVRDTHKPVTMWLDKYGINNRRAVLFPTQWTSWAKLGQGDMLIWEMAEERIKLPRPKEDTLISMTLEGDLYQGHAPSRHLKSALDGNGCSYNSCPEGAPEGGRKDWS
ncbi:uncharacterized protein F5147DRAFT_652957 [Suillus discolor]|uniref:Uncharacterized protein n=1 Tax=Suillus discolor TaxID=1912936 RepID=A0A9P7F7A9_9AGAM|nr:uncharacterized protein F5147DRAFT_652957 [Suillus discolor]KAG2108237.1 hypothetical protein F5147DRAFT_652957 [Suillus discolor]